MIEAIFYLGVAALISIAVCTRYVDVTEEDRWK
jgi:hypothetical protein